MNNLKEMKRKELFLALIVGAIALFSFLSFTFHAFKVTEDTEALLGLAGYGSLGSMTNMNAFNLIEHLGDLGGVCKTYTWLDVAALIASIIAIGYFAYALLNKDSEERVAIYKKVIIIALAISILMLIQGFHLTNKTNDNFWMGVEMGGSDSSTLKALGDFGYETEGYWPIIITAILTVGYWLVDKKLPED